MTHRRTHETGFTLVEVAITAAILSVVMLIISSSFVSLVRVERHAVNLRDSIQSTRTALGTLVSDGRTASTALVTTPDANGNNQVCFFEGTSTVVHYFVATAPDAPGPMLYKFNEPVSKPAVCNVADYATVSTSTNANLSNALAANVVATTFTVLARNPANGAGFATIRLGTSTDLVASDIQGVSDANPGSCSDVSDSACAVSIIETSVSLQGAVR